MSASLGLNFFGIPQLVVENHPVDINRRAVLALLAYLAVNDDGQIRQKHSREALSALFWPDYDQAKAFANLRHTLWEIQQALGNGWLVANRETISFNAKTMIWVDVRQFEASLLECDQQNDVSLRLPLLAEAVKLYRHHFLAGFRLKSAPAFNEWTLAKSEALQDKLARALTLLSEGYCALGNAESAIPYARRLVTLDLLNESAHRQLMQVYIQADQSGAALKQYQVCEQILRKELGLDPQSETRALYKQIRKGKHFQARIQDETLVAGILHTRLALIALQEEKFGEARANLEKAQAIFERNAPYALDVPFL